MADKSRSINTKIWDDPYFQELSSNEKLLFIYLLTNPMTNLLGVYEITLRRISFDIGIGKETISKHLKRFTKDKKVFYKDNYIVISNFLKNQSLNSNMKLGVSNIFNQLPKTLRDSILGNDSQTLSNDYQSILNAMLKYEIEIEKETEIKIKSKSEKRNCLFKNSGITIDLIQIAFKETKDLELADPEHYYSAALDWSDSNNKMKTDWIATIRGFVRSDIKKGNPVMKKIEDKEHYEILEAKNYSDLTLDEREFLSIYKMKHS